MFYDGITFAGPLRWDWSIVGFLTSTVLISEVL
jgi:hypothetical protein